MIFPVKELSTLLVGTTKTALEAACASSRGFMGGTLQAPLYDTSHNWHPTDLFVFNPATYTKTPWTDQIDASGDVNYALLLLCQDKVFTGLPFSIPDDLLYDEDESVSDDDVQDYGFQRFHDRTFTFLTNGHCFYLLREKQADRALAWLDTAADPEEDEDTTPPAFILTTKQNSNHDTLDFQANVAPLLAATPYMD